MKRFNFLLVAIALVVTVSAVSCTVVPGAQDDYYSQDARAYSNRVYVDDPYRGTVVLERDPRTGRYYEVSPYYDGYYSSRTYGRYRTYGNSYPTYRRNNSGYSSGNNSNSNQNNNRSSEEYRKNREEARSKVLGGSR